MSDDEFGDLSFDDDALQTLDRAVETFQATQNEPRAKKPRLESSPPRPDITFDEHGGYSYAVDPDEDEIIDQRQTLPPPIVKPAPTPAPPPRIDDSQLRTTQDELATIKARLAQAETAAQAAIQGEQSKTGEVENLRRNIERDRRQQDERTKAHQDALAQLRAELEEERRQRKHDAERWSTELTFKEQEMESTRRRKSRGAAQASQWTDLKSPAAKGGSHSLRKSVSSPSPKKPGFKNLHNSFMDAATPSKASQALATPLSRKGKAKVIDVDSIANGMDVDQTPPPADLTTEEEPFSWSKQLLRVLFSHHVALPKPDSLEFARALPLLLHAQLPNDADPRLLAEYEAFCSRLVEVVGSVVGGTAETEDIELCNNVCRCVVAMIDVVLQMQQTTLLIAALSLLASLATNVRLFVWSMLLHSKPSPFETSRPSSCVMLSQCLASFLDLDGDVMALRATNEVLTVLETFVWQPSPDELHALDTMLRDTDIFAHLLREKTPPDILMRGLRLLTLFAGQKSLFRPILSTPMTPNEGRPQDYFMPIVERLASLLAMKDGENSLRLPLAVFDFVVVLSKQHADATTLLTESGSLLARILALLRYDTSAIYDGDGSRFEENDEALRETFVRLTSALRVMHHLVCSPDSNVDLNTVLSHQHAVPGARLMFTVSIGRLAFADPPDWLPVPFQKALEQVSEPASTILDHQLVPEELDQLYTLYADPSDSEMTEDEGIVDAYVH